MNKLVAVFGVAAVATLAGCKDPDYKSLTTPSQDDVKIAEPAPQQQAIVAEKPTCRCAPGTKHEVPCACGAPDCKCVVVAKPLPPPPPVRPAEPEYTTYIVQNGDFLSKISVKYNVSISSIKRLNGLKSDVIRVGQKLKLPGKIDVGVQTAPVKPAAAKAAVVRGAAEYKGATKEYVVKNGDTLGAIAYGNGCNIRQLKKLNNLTSDSLKIGQKLKIPADGKAAANAKTPKMPKGVEKAPVAKKPVTAKPEEPVAPAEDAAAKPTEPAAAPATTEAAAPVAEAPKAAAPAAAATTTYTVKEGEDITGVSIRFNVSAAAIRELNGLGEDAQLTAGQVIKLPAEAQK